MSAHTPGPWRRCERQPDAIVGPRCESGTCQACDEVQAGWYEDDNEETQRTYGDHFGGHFVCESVNGPDAALVVAAPELLAALERAAEDLYEEFGYRPYTELIARANGQQP